MNTPSSPPVAGGGTHSTTAVQVGSAQSARPSPLLSMPSRQSLSGLRSQGVALHWKNGWHPSLLLHVVKQPLEPQARPLGQLPPWTELQVPLPSHLPSQAAPQMVCADGWWQLDDVPSQLPAHEPAPLHAARGATGVPLTGKH